MKPLILSHKILDRLIPSRFDAVNLYFFVLVRTGSKNDAALIEHEKHHTVQVTHYGISYIWKYYRDPKFRMEREAEAYAVQIVASEYKMSVDYAAGLLWRNYDLNIQLYEAKQAVYDALIGLKYD